MIVCPDCAFENIEGTDICEGCGHTLTEMSLRLPSSSVESALLRDQIEKLDPRTPITVEPITPVSRILQTLVEHRVGCVVVTDNETVVGIFSERDAFLRIGTKAADLADRPIDAFMTPNPVMLETKDKIAFAIHKMNLGGYRHIPILNDGKLTGIISVRDILDYLSRRISTAKTIS